VPQHKEHTRRHVADITATPYVSNAVYEYQVKPLTTSATALRSNNHTFLPLTLAAGTFRKSATARIQCSAMKVTCGLPAPRITLLGGKFVLQQYPRADMFGTA